MPPKTPIRIGLRRRCQGRGPAGFQDITVVRISLPHRIAKVASVLGVLDRLVRLEQSQVRILGFSRIRMLANHVLEIEDRRVECFPLQIEIAGGVILLREPFVQLGELGLRALGEG